MKKEKINKAAEILFNSRFKITKLKNLPNDCTPRNKADAYFIQDALAKLYRKQNNSKIIGKKIGCTNKKAQEQINVNEPFYGNIYSTFFSKNKCNLERNKFINPYFEPEFSFKLKDKIDISKGPFTVNQIYEYIESVIPSIEIVDSRFEDWTSIGIYNLIADNAANAFWIKGEEEAKLNQLNLFNHTVKVYINNNLIEEGNSKNVLKNPLNSLTWLINTLYQQGKNLDKDNYISTGTCTSAIPVSNKAHVMADFGILGKVEFQIN